MWQCPLDPAPAKGGTEGANGAEVAEGPEGAKGPEGSEEAEGVELSLLGRLQAVEVSRGPDSELGG